MKNYQAGDLERLYEKAGVEEDFFVVYGFVTKELAALMHPRSGASWPAETTERAAALLEFVRQRGTAHPREVDEHFAHGRVTNYRGGSSNATTHLLGQMQYRGMLRVARREKGIRIYAAHEHGPGPADENERSLRIDALADAAVRIYAPLHAGGLQYLIRRLRYAVPQWQGEITAAVKCAKERLSHALIDGVDWYWPAGERATGHAAEERVRLLTPFDAVVWDRDRLELLWGWVYRFEAYTPTAKRMMGYYALPLLWRDQVIGWGNLSVSEGKLNSEFGYASGKAPRDRAFRRELEAELERMRGFPGV